MKRAPYASVGQEIGFWQEAWIGDSLHNRTGTGVVVASSRSKKILPAYEAMRILGVHDLEIETWHRVTKVDIENGDAEPDSVFGHGASGAGWIRVAIPSWDS